MLVLAPNNTWAGVTVAAASTGYAPVRACSLVSRPTEYCVSRNGDTACERFGRLVMMSGCGDASGRSQRLFSRLYELLPGRVRLCREARGCRRGDRDRCRDVPDRFGGGLTWCPAQPLPWLYRVARNVLLRYHSTVARHAQTRSALAHEPVAPADVLVDGGDERLWEAWEQLREQDREVLALVAWEELSVAQAARVLGCAAPVFSVRLHRARRRLAGLLASPPKASALEPSEAHDAVCIH